jgi:hypothetical protein
MPLEPLSSAVVAFIVQVEEMYATLLHSAASAEAGLGGKLLYAGSLDASGRAITVAANIAGAATLAACADPAAARQSVREGIVDFLVNSLDEALRILKNQVRKRETVAVCVSLDPAVIEAEMHARGVVPDLLRSNMPDAPRRQEFPYQEGAFREGAPDESGLSKILALVVWRVDSALSKDLALLDEVALECLDEKEECARRWLRRAPRYLGRLAQGLRVLLTHREFAARFGERLRRRANGGEIGFAYEIRTFLPGLEERQFFDPQKP